MNPLRAAFEQAFRRVYPMACSAGALDVGEDGFYRELETRLAFRMWRAAFEAAKATGSA